MERSTFAAAVASGFRDLVALPGLPGVLQTALAERGIPVIEGEVGGLGTTTRENVTYYAARVTAVARHLSVLAREAELPSERPRPRLWHLHGVDAVAGGLFRREVELRQAVTAGDSVRCSTWAMGRVEMCAHRSPRSWEGIGSMPACGLGIGS